MQESLKLYNICNSYQNPLEIVRPSQFKVVLQKYTLQNLIIDLRHMGK